MIKKLLEKKITEQIKHFPTKDQQKAIEELAKFVDTNNRTQIFILTGFAGTGKTTLISALVNALYEEEIHCVLLAPTGRAAKVFSNASISRAYTIHKIIYKAEVLKNGIVRFFLTKCKFKNTIFIIDEASMIADKKDKKSIFGSGNLLDDLIEFVFQKEGNKIIFTGDTAQLPPVGFDNSPALEPHTFARFNLDVATSQLKEIVRQANDSGIVFNANIIRTSIEKQRLFQYPKLQLNQFNDVEKINGNQLIEYINNSYQNEGIDNSIVITYSNHRANKYNEGIRNSILHKESNIARNDYVMIVRNNYLWKDEDQIIDFIANGDIGIIRSLKNFEQHNGFNFVDATIDMLDYGGVIKVKMLLNTIDANAPTLSEEESKELYEYFSSPYKEIKDSKKRYQEIRNDPYINSLQIKFSYAITCHKAQGGQWNNVFIDQSFLKSEMITLDYLRWLYTAFTRAKNKVYLVNFNKEFFE